MKALTILTLMLASTVAFAQPESEQGSFDDYDTNRDGQISVSEAEQDARMLQAFTLLDKDNNGLVSREEFNAQRAQEEQD